MSQGFNQACFNFSDGFQRSKPHDQQIHVAQQSRRDKLRVQQGFETAVQDQEPAEIAPLYEGMMLSEMFNFPAAADQIPANWRFNSNPNSYWLSRHQQQQQQQQQQESLSSLGVAKSNTNNDSNNFTHHQISDINAADPTVAMQLFLMSPQTLTDPSSSSPSTPLQFLGNPHQQIQALNFPAAGFPTGNNPAEFEWNSAKNKSWVPGESQQNNNNTTTTTTITNNNGNRDNQGLSLSLSSLQHLEAAIQRNGEVEKVEELKMDNGVLLYSHGSSSSLKNFENSMQVPQHLIGRNFGNSMQNHQQFDMGLMGNLGNSIQTQRQQQQQFHHQMGSLSLVSVLRNSKYLKGAHELLEEFCSVGRGQFKNRNRLGLKHDNPKWGNPNPNPSSSSSSSKDLPPLSPTERFEQQRRKAKLLAMLDEVDRRYNHYCEQMQMVVNSFDYIMGIGAATPYTSLAQKAMSRHFRCLRDAIGNQLKITSELLGEKDGGGVSGITKGETPRLRLLEQSLRQQRSFSQMGMMEQEAWRPQRGLPERSVNILRAWLFEHFLNPYPSDADKHLLARQTGLSRNQVSNWFINARVRLWKPMVEEMYQEESKAENQQQQQHHNAQTPDPSPSKRTQLNAHESDTSQTAINKHSNLAGHLPFSENQAFNTTNSPESLDFPTIDHRKNSNDADDDDRADILLPTTAAAGYNCVSLTLGLRHTGNQPENNQFSGNCGFKVPSMNQILRDFAG